MMSGTKNEQGFSMVELLIAMVLVGTLLVAAMTGFAQAVASTGKVRNHTIALNLAKERLEFLKQYEQNSTNNRDSNVWTTNSSYSKTYNNVEYRIDTSKIDNTELQTPYDDSAATKYVIPIRVTVNWSEKGKNHSVSLETFFYSSYSS
jgi:prepilin-type N-terminal cleavage/methylation domain-containing protein